jgi:hypothetical protein
MKNAQKRDVFIWDILKSIKYKNVGANFLINCAKNVRQHFLFINFHQCHRKFKCNPLFPNIIDPREFELRNQKAETNSTCTFWRTHKTCTRANYTVSNVQTFVIIYSRYKVHLNKGQFEQPRQ